MARKNIVLCVMLLINLTTMAQIPNWTNYEVRQKLFPRKYYFTGFASECKNVSNPELFENLITVAQRELAQSIETTIKSVSSLKTIDKQTNSSINTSINFTSHCVSKSIITITDLQRLTYFDKKTKTAYALVYIKKNDLINHNKSLLKLTTEKIKDENNQYLSLNSTHDFTQNLETLLNIKRMFSKYDETTALLTSLKSYPDIDTVIESIRKSINVRLNNLMQDSQFGLEECSIYLATNIALKLDNTENIFLNDIFFKNSPLTSHFSELLKNKIQNRLSLLKIKVLESKELKSPDYELNGNYYVSKKSSFAEINIDLTDKTHLSLFSISVKLPLHNFTDTITELLPKFVKKYNDIKTLEIIPNINEYSLKKGQQIKPITAKCQTNDKKTLQGVPVYTVSQSGKSSIQTSNNEGIVSFIPSANQFKEKNNILKFVVDFNRWFAPDTNGWCQKQIKLLNINTPKIIIKKIAPVIYVNSDEVSNSAVLESKIKQMLVNKDYEFTSQNTIADYSINIRTSSKTTANYYGITYVICNATISIYDRNSNKEIFKNQYTEKGNGIDKQQAVSRGMSEIIPKLANDIKDIL